MIIKKEGSITNLPRLYIDSEELSLMKFLGQTCRIRQIFAYLFTEFISKIFLFRKAIKLEANKRHWACYSCNVRVDWYPAGAAAIVQLMYPTLTRC